MIALYYKFSVQEKYVNQAISQARKVQKHFIDNVDGCIQYQCTQDLDDKTIMYIFCIWESKEKHEKALESDFFQKEILDKHIEYKASILLAKQMTISKLIDGI